MMPSHFAELNGFFDGNVRFPILAAGKDYVWYLGQVPDLFDDETGVLRQWTVTAEYLGTASTEPFRETFVLDLDIEKRREVPIDPLDRIGRDIEVVGREMKGIGKELGNINTAVRKR
ncbi:hypothetical protein AEQ27_09885 [Frigoribacterium sp. RIT-PI-h]|nr:hypothetical protein AEQ27_09885 [Frigoribacterium sp. RIT-PI-h]